MELSNNFNKYRNLHCIISSKPPTRIASLNASLRLYVLWARVQFRQLASHFSIFDPESKINFSAKRTGTGPSKHHPAMRQHPVRLTV
jgi:hypothetical protein